jgi:DNA gyrase subunit A
MPVSEGFQVMLISNGGTVIRMPVDEIKRLGRSTQGVIVMRLRGDEQVSSIALVAESEEPIENGEAVPEAADASAEDATGENGNL